MRLYGCVDSRLDGMTVKVDRTLTTNERKRFSDEEMWANWVWVLTPYGRTFVQKERLRS